MTLRSQILKSNGKVSATTPHLYADWRLRAAASLILREEGREPPPERLLQAIWFHQRILRETLATVDGRRLCILHPGFWSYEGGPDFRGAVVQFEGATPRSGDVEIDLVSSGWRAHRHHVNPAFKNTVLHAVWQADKPGPLPTLELKGTLDSPLPQLAVWLANEAPVFPEALAGQCSGPLRHLSAGQVEELLRQAAQLRLESKAAQFQARARQAGWEQALWEGLFRALGYKHNTWPMLRLAELRERLLGPKSLPLELQARLLGVGGLLPNELTRRTAADSYLREIWNHWWRERSAFDDCLLPRELWHFHALRPANHPQRRLALAAHWLAAGDLPRRLETWCAEKLPETGLLPHLYAALDLPKDEFWSWHWTLRSRRTSKSQPLLGTTRLTDLAMNVFLPWLWSRAGEGRNEKVRQELERRYFAWPSAQDNALLRLARQRLFGGSPPLQALRHAAAQQGLLQIVHDFCDHSNALCSQCRFPELVRAWPA